MENIPVFDIAMHKAAAEARRWLGATAPNPPVGAAALDVYGNVIAVAAHHRAGAAHAENLLLQQCREQNLLGTVATLCVTLEPCNHHGRTPPCTEAIIAAGIQRVVIGCRDPNPHVAGGGAARLRAAGIEVVEDVAANACRQLIRAFHYKVTTGRPWVTVKQALDLNGSMIPPSGQKTFTSPDSLKLAHRLRKRADAIITGSGTILADSPHFTVRHVPDHPEKQRFLIILDRRGRVPTSYLALARERGMIGELAIDLEEALKDLAQKGAVEVLIEAGPALTRSVLDSKLWTEWVQIKTSSARDADAISVRFNPDARLPFDPHQFCWDYVLPQEFVS